jgi:type I restriction enzyme R subunit
MANYITEDDIEVSLINILKNDELAYNFIQCDSNPNTKEDLNDGTGRTSKKQCVLPEQIKTALYKINPDIPAENIDSVIRDLCRDFTGTDMVKTNYDNYNLIRNGKKVDFKKDGKQTFDKEAFDSKINLLLNHFVDMSVQHYGWLGEVA